MAPQTEHFGRMGPLSSTRARLQVRSWRAQPQPTINCWNVTLSTLSFPLCQKLPLVERILTDEKEQAETSFFLRIGSRGTENRVFQGTKIGVTSPRTLMTGIFRGRDSGPSRPFGSPLDVDGLSTVVWLSFRITAYCVRHAHLVGTYVVGRRHMRPSCSWTILDQGSHKYSRASSTHDLAAISFRRTSFSPTFRTRRRMAPNLPNSASLALHKSSFS